MNIKVTVNRDGDKTSREAVPGNSVVRLSKTVPKSGSGFCREQRQQTVKGKTKEVYTSNAVQYPLKKQSDFESRTTNSFNIRSFHSVNSHNAVKSHDYGSIAQDTFHQDIGNSYRLEPSFPSTSNSNLVTSKNKVNASSSAIQSHTESVTQAVIDVCRDQKCLDEASINKVLGDINKVVEKNMPGCNVRLYGSYLSGFAITNSDVNLDFQTSANSINEKFFRIVSRLFENVLPEYHIQLKESRALRNFYITCFEPNIEAECNIRYFGGNEGHFHMSELLKKICCYDFNRIRPLIIAFRIWAEICNIHEEKNGRLHPLAFVFMAIHFLQRTEPPVLPVVKVNSLEDMLPRNELSVGELWIRLFKYYSTEFNWHEHVINITSSTVKDKSSYKWGKCWIGIENPFDENDNIAKSIISQDVSFYIQQCFKKTFSYFSSNGNEIIERENSDDARQASITRLKFSFTAYNFTNGLDIPSMCEECLELGYVCDDCALDSPESHKSVPFTELPIEYLETITTALKDASAFHLLCDEEIASRQKLVQDMEIYIAERITGAKLELIGSSVNGFGLKSSDLDICMTIQGKNSDDFDKEKMLFKLRFHLRKNQEFSHVFAVISAKIPLVQFYHLKTKLRGDISFYNLLAVYNTKLLHSYSIIDNRAKILGCAMKLLAKNACIGDSSRKALSSYSYILMVIHFLQNTNPPILPVLQESTWNSSECIVEGCNVSFLQFCHVEDLLQVWERKSNPMSVGELWVEFLKYYTEIYDASKVITIRQREMPSSSTIVQSHGKLFNIEDPFIVSKNLGSVMSYEMSRKTWNALLQAKKLFNRPLEHIPSGFKSFSEYFFDPMCLTDGRVTKTDECDLCGKFGHKRDNCPRSMIGACRGRGSIFRSKRFHNCQKKKSV